MNTQKTIKLNLLSILAASIDTYAYTDEKFKTQGERASFVLECYTQEFDYYQNQVRYPNEYQRIANWLQGLPSVCTVPFYNNEILEIGYKLGMIKHGKSEVSKESAEQKFLEGWFKLMACKLVQMSTMKKHAESQLIDFLSSEV